VKPLSKLNVLHMQETCLAWDVVFEGEQEPQTPEIHAAQTTDSRDKDRQQKRREREPQRYLFRYGVLLYLPTSLRQ
jgi:hypothetical protein